MTMHRPPLDPARRCDLHAYIALVRGVIAEGGRVPHVFLLQVTAAGRATATAAHDHGRIDMLGVRGTVTGAQPTATALLDAWLRAALDRLAAEVRS